MNTKIIGVDVNGTALNPSDWIFVPTTGTVTFKSGTYVTNGDTVTMSITYTETDDEWKFGDTLQEKVRTERHYLCLTDRDLVEGLVWVLSLDGPGVGQVATLWKTEVVRIG